MNTLKIQFLLLPLLFLSFINKDAASVKEHISVFSLSVTKKSAKPGDTVCLDVIASQFDNIVSMQYTMKWDKKVLRYKNVQEFKVPALNKDNFGANSAADKGQLTFSWFDPKVRGISLNPGTSLYQVCFDVIGESGDKAFFQFTDYPTVSEIMQGNGNFLHLEWTSGKVTVQ